MKFVLWREPEPSPMSENRHRGRAFTWLLLAATLPLVGCGYEDLNTFYGYRSGGFGGESVNGTGVLGGMFEEAGHSVKSRRYLTPKLKEADVIVWFPDDFTPPDKKRREWIQDWLDEGGHTMIYVGRDYDAAPHYWEEVYPKMPANLQHEARLRKKEAEVDFTSERTSVPQEEDAEWFAVDGKATPMQVKSLGGDWADGIDASKAKIELNSRYEPSEWAEILLESGQGDLLVSREWYGGAYNRDDSKLIIVTNGSFLLNYPLINHEHRKLAGKLIGEVPDDAKVVFLEGAEPEIMDKEPETEIPTGVEMFSVWPVNWILVHLAVLGAIFLLARWPIFGLARELKEGSNADFGRHVKAMAELLARTKDRGFAIARLQQYRQLMGKESATATPFAASSPANPPSSSGPPPSDGKDFAPNFEMPQS